MGKQSVIIVEAKKIFTYPKSMLSKDFFFKDALVKAKQDIQIFFDEILNKDHENLDISMFEFHVSEDPGYKFRKPEINTSGMISIHNAVKIISTREIEKKYGPLNPDLTPDLFERVSEQKDELGNIIQEETFYLKGAIEEELQNNRIFFENLFISNTTTIDKPKRPSH